MKHYDSKSIYLNTPVEILKFKNEEDFKSYIKDLNEESLNEFELDLGRSNSNKRTFLNKNYGDNIKNELFKKQGLIVILISIVLLGYGFFTINTIFVKLEDINFISVINGFLLLIGLYLTGFSISFINNKLLKIPKNFILDGSKIIVKGPFNLTLAEFYPKSVSLHSLSKSGSYILKFVDNNNRAILAVPMANDVFGPTNYYKDFYDNIAVKFQVL